MSNFDNPSKVREGESIDLVALRNYLKEVDGAWDQELELKQFPAGYSNLTYWLKIGSVEYVLRRPPIGANVKGGHDMGREFKVLDGLKTVFQKVPKVYHYCADEKVIGGSFYIMERVNGIILRNQVKLEAAQYQSAAWALLNTFVELHQVDFKAAGLEELGKPAGYVERQIVGWTKRYEKTKTDEAPALEQAIKWLNEHIKEESSHGLIHNDFKYDNIVFDTEDWSKVVAVLDWEMATLGDPLMDLGSSMAYWVGPDDPPSARLMTSLPTYYPGNPTRLELVTQYEALSGKKVDNFTFYYAYGLFKLAVVVQQIYYRFKKGYTKDPRFAHLNQQTIQLGNMAWQAIQKNRIVDLF